MIITSEMIPLFAALPLAGAFVIALLKKIKGIPDIIGVLIPLVVFVLSVFSVLQISDSNSPRVLETSVGEWGAEQIGGHSYIAGIQLVLDGLTAFMLVIVNFVAFVVAVYSMNYMTRYTEKWQYFTLFLLMLAGMNGVIITGDLFNLFVFLEIASIASYALVAFGTGKRELEASFKYAVMGGVGSMFILLGIVFLYSATGLLNMHDMAVALAGQPNTGLLYLVFALLLTGFGLKAAVVPFHAWLPDAHPSAPAPISAMLSGVLIKALGIYAIMRIFYTIFGFPQQIASVLMVLGAVSMGVGAVVAMRQWDLKRLLAYSSISQIGFIMLALGIGTELAIIGALFHLFNHSVFKSLLFLDSGALEYATNTRDLKKMGGIRERMFVTSSTTMAGAMSLAGIPPFAGFWSKLIIIVAAVQANHLGYAAWAVVVSIATIAYALKATRFAFLGKLNEKYAQLNEVPAFMRISLVILAVVCVFGGLLLIPAIKDSFLEIAAEVLLKKGGV